MVLNPYKYRLSEATHQAVIKTDIMPDTFAGAPPTPTAILAASQVQAKALPWMPPPVNSMQKVDLPKLSGTIPALRIRPVKQAYLMPKGLSGIEDVQRAS